MSYSSMTQFSTAYTVWQAAKSEEAGRMCLQKNTHWCPYEEGEGLGENERQPVQT